jgi:hypothetical protein
MEQQNYVTLKWGTTKSYSFPDKPEALVLLKELDEIEENSTAPTDGLRNRQTDRQKEIIGQLIDLSDGDTIYLHWDGKYVSKDEAKEYVNTYGDQ